MDRKKRIRIPIILKGMIVIISGVLVISVFLENQLQSIWRLFLSSENGSIDEVQFLAKQQFSQMKQTMYMILGVVLLILLLMIGFYLYRMHRIKKAMEEIACGNPEVELPMFPIFGNDEFGDLLAQFDRILVNSIGSSKEKEDLITACYRFIPHQMFALLNKEDITEVALEDQTDSEVTILTINTMLFSDLIHTMETREMFAFINQVLERIVPVVSSKGGIIDKFVDAGMAALYIEKSEEALTSALLVCKAMEELDRKTEVSVGLCHGSVMIGIVGHEERQAILTISIYTALSAFLQSAAPKYNAKILVTATFAEQIESFDKKYNSRCIGYFYISSTKSLEKIYDVFDGDTSDVQWRKKKTKTIFEQGVALFTRKKFEEARLHFIEVLKVYRMDAASKEYLFLCDYFRQPEHREGANVYVERY